MDTTFSRRSGMAAAGCLALLAGLASAPARANDSMAAIGAGGLQLVATDIVELVREDLTIATDRITVRYVFRNLTETDLETLVAFPLPPIDLRHLYDTDLGPLDSENYLDFTVMSDGEPIAPASESRATVLGHDVSGLLADYGLPVAGYENRIFDVLEALPPEDRAILQAEGVAMFDDSGGDVYAFPTWTFQTIYYWPQHFAAGAETVIEHSYRPIAGGQFFGAYDAEMIRSGETFGWAEFCLDGPALDAAEALAGDSYLFTRYVDYILTTANNWSGPIRNFHLTVEKGAPDDLVVTCMDGLEDTGPTTLELTLTDFAPTEDLSVLFIQATPME